MEPKILKVTFTEQYKFDLIRVLLNELSIKSEEYFEECDTFTEEEPISQILLENEPTLIKITHPVTKKSIKESDRKTQFKFWFAKKTGDQVIKTIRERQVKYFETGKTRDLVPMIYRDVAQDIEKDISTVARIAEIKKFRINGKLVSYKELFKEGSLKTKDGRLVSQYEFFDEILDIIDSENKRKPYTDEDIAFELERRGYLIARRTVAKYRDEFLKIPNSNERKIWQ